MADSAARPVNERVGEPVDVSFSAYQYRADRPAEANPPEAWWALMHHAGQPLNVPVDPRSEPVARVLCSLLWEEIRPLERLALSWAVPPAGLSPDQVEVTTLDHQGTASSWWNNLRDQVREVSWTVSQDRTTWTCPLRQDTCGVVLACTAGAAAGHSVPTMAAMTGARWKQLDFQVEWAFQTGQESADYSGRVEVYDGRLAALEPLAGDTGTTMTGPVSWRSLPANVARRGLQGTLLYAGTSCWRSVYPFTSQDDDVARTIVTLWTAAGAFSFLAADLEHGPIFAPEFGFFVRAISSAAAVAGATWPASPSAEHRPPIDLAVDAATARLFVEELRRRQLGTVRQALRARPERTWQEAVSAMRGDDLPLHPVPPPEFAPAMQVEVPCRRLQAQWNLGAWHLLRHCQRHPGTGRLWFNDHPYGVLAAETYMVLAALDLMGLHREAADGYEQWLSLPLDPNSAGHHDWALPDRPNGLFTDGHGCLTHAVGPEGVGGHMDGVHAFGPGSIGWALIEHFRLTGDSTWFAAAAPRLQANVEWVLRQRRVGQNLMPGGARLWGKGLQLALQVTPDSGGLWMPFYECEAYYWLAVAHFADALVALDPVTGAALQAEAEAYRRDLLAAVERSVALSPVVAVRDGTYHSVIPFACYVRGLSTGAWGWRRDGSGQHVGPMYWETVQSAAPLVSPAGLLAPDDVRVQGYLDVLEDRLLLENAYVAGRPYWEAGWQYQGGLERTANMHLAADDIPVFIRSFMNCYAVDILPHDGYVFNEHAVHGPPDKIFEEAAFLERFRHLLVSERGGCLWLARGTPRAWLDSGQRVAVRHAPTHYGPVSYEITSNLTAGYVDAILELPERQPPAAVILRLRHPQAAALQRVRVGDREWTDFDPRAETIRLAGLRGSVSVRVWY